ncbi:short-chain dehydrogenase, putative [Trypanosoma brucei gambiense DAL972]|uniref:Short-chain dehydrogenase, putative n=2 Tax=Trypanosoma brucei TaxID=5691 RepID=D0A8K5_TRYB9|nr:short-chain dehydrogenase, putative [Trypanosoma brucei gambiense DAL972]RHW68388.1 short-chain dehydrogenase [Trypanosoma brucei equiperdum]CBH18006.1 short-chain dehydrogenase, putative [Trypanosoma brucei gambiense DAL972]|eukprot:XP_011780270.1 short-chain dehydrogenase, putative [Trypanosoma brucei gambiense DAL972]
MQLLSWSSAAKALFGLTVARLLLAFLYRRLYRHLYYHPLVPGSVALITGGGSGMGLEFARYFARAGCHVVLVGRDADALRSALASCVELGSPSAEMVVADLNTIEGTNLVCFGLRDIIEQKRLHGQFRYLVLNAGLGAILPFSSGVHFYETCESVMQINYFANVRLLQGLLSLLEETHSAANPSRVIVVSSLAGVLPSVLRSAYTASKHAIQGFANALRGETEVAITLFCPGYVDTDFHSKATLIKGDGAPVTSHRRGMAPDVAVGKCMEGVLSGRSEVLTPFVGKLGYILRPLFTRLVDSRAKKMSHRSLQK